MDIQLIIGPMFSGKTSELMKFAKNAKAIDLRVLVINHTFDTRCADNLIRTHDGVEFDAKKASHLSDVNIDNYDVICIDEAQFFGDLKKFILENEMRDVKVYISGLDGDFERKPFGQILEIIPLCENVRKLNAMCCVSKDGTPAAFTKRIVDGRSTIQIGGAGDYISVSRKHYH